LQEDILASGFPTLGGDWRILESMPRLNKSPKSELGLSRAFLDSVNEFESETFDIFGYERL
jgi:hypothetical protein